MTTNSQPRVPNQQSLQAMQRQQQQTGSRSSPQRKTGNGSSIFYAKLQP